MVTVGTHATPSSCSNTTLAWPGTAPPWPSNTTQAWDTRYSPAPQPRYPWEPYAKYPLTPAMTAPPPALQRWQHPHIDKVAHVRAYHRLREKARGLDSIAFAAVVAAVGVWLSGANPRPQMPVIMLQLYRAALPWLPTCCYWLSALLVLRAMLMLLRWKKRDLEWMPAHKRLSAQSQALLGLDKDARLPQDFDLVTPDMCSTPAESLASRDSRYTSTTSAAGLRPRTPKQDQPSRSPLVRESNTQPSRAASQTSPLFATPGPVAWAPVQRARKHAAGNDVWTSAELDRLKAETRTVRRPGTGIQGYSGGYVSQFEGPARGQPNPLPFRKMEGDCMAPAMPHAARPITEQTWELRRKAEESYKALGIADEIETWAENIKIWLVTQVLQPVLMDMPECDKFFTSQNAPIFLCGSSLSEPQQTGGFGGAQKTRQQILEEELPKRQGLEARLVQRRLTIERFLNLSANPLLRSQLDPATLRQYALDRLREFAWDPAKVARESQRDPQGPDGRAMPGGPGGLPNDFLMLMHFCSAYFDEHTPPIGGQGFMQRHFMEAHPSAIQHLGQGLGGCPSDVMIVQTQCDQRPYFFVVSKAQRRGTSHYTLDKHYTKPQQNSLFQAMAVFFHLYRDRSGHRANHHNILDTVDISKPPVNILSHLMYSTSSQAVKAHHRFA